MNRLLIIGASGHGKVAADIAKKRGYEKIAFLDDDSSVEHCGEYKVIGKTKEAMRWPEDDFVVALGDAIIRERIMENLEKHFLKMISLIHPAAVVADDVRIGIGTMIMAGAVINPGTTIGKGCIVNTGATIDHDCRIGDYCHVSVGSHLAGTVSVAARTWIGIGAIVSNNIEISTGCMIGAGAVVVRDIAESGTYIGVPAIRMSHYAEKEFL